MITCRDNIFHLATRSSSYLFRITRFGHPESIHYGELLDLSIMDLPIKDRQIHDPSIEALRLKHSAEIGSSVKYDPSDPLYCLDTIALEWSGIGKGDYRHSPAEIKMPDGTFVADFIFQSFRIIEGSVTLQTLPTAYGDTTDCQTLELNLLDTVNQVTLLMYYTVYENCDIITRRTVLINQNAKPLLIRKLMSLMIDLPSRNYTLITFQGGWIKETHRQNRPLSYGLFVQQSTTGASSNRQNPGFLLAEQGAGEQHGRVFGFNLVYSGNHYAGVELSSHDLVRVMTGINPHCFEWPLQTGEQFETPEAVMTFSDQGLNRLSQNFHDFINRHIVRGEWQDKERPVLINNWEAHFFKFNGSKLLRLARRAKRLGVELFVLDDGWFGQRNNDRGGLGDYTVNYRKLHGGLGRFARRINRIGLQFGLWFEPEMVNPDSDLYRAHPDYAVAIPGRSPALGRNQLALDLCSREVRDYIVNSVRGVLDSANISYVKWDMNRHLSDMYSAGLVNQGEFFHRYIIGLYDILHRIFVDKPDILLETCSSGGNRFDLGMLCFSPQIWASDDTDPVERLAIQQGLSYLYPPSTIGAHVSSAPHQQTLRQTPLSTRFNVAGFGCLGYEMDLKYLSPVEKREVRDQITFYKQHRRTLQFGRFFRFDALKTNKVHFQSVAADGRESIAGFFQTLATANEGFDFLPLTGLEPTARYSVKTRPQSLAIRRFGALINHILPFHVNPEGLLVRLVNKYYSMPDCVEAYQGRGDSLQAGIKLNNQFVGSNYNAQTRLLGDFGSNLYLIQRLNQI